MFLWNSTTPTMFIARRNEKLLIPIRGERHIEPTRRLRFVEPGRIVYPHHPPSVIARLP